MSRANVFSTQISKVVSILLRLNATRHAVARKQIQTPNNFSPLPINFLLRAATFLSPAASRRPPYRESERVLIPCSKPCRGQSRFTVRTGRSCLSRVFSSKKQKFTVLSSFVRSCVNPWLFVSAGGASSIVVLLFFGVAARKKTHLYKRNVWKQIKRRRIRNTKAVVPPRVYTCICVVFELPEIFV